MNYVNSKGLHIFIGCTHCNALCRFFFVMIVFLPKLSFYGSWCSCRCEQLASPEFCLCYPVNLWRHQMCAVEPVKHIERTLYSMTNERMGEIQVCMSVARAGLIWGLGFAIFLESLHKAVSYSKAILRACHSFRTIIVNSRKEWI